MTQAERLAVLQSPAVHGLDAEALVAFFKPRKMLLRDYDVIETLCALALMEFHSKVAWGSEMEETETYEHAKRVLTEMRSTILYMRDFALTPAKTWTADIQPVHALAGMVVDAAMRVPSLTLFTRDPALPSGNTRRAVKEINSFIDEMGIGVE